MTIIHQCQAQVINYLSIKLIVNYFSIKLINCRLEIPIPNHTIKKSRHMNRAIQKSHLEAFQMAFQYRYSNILQQNIVEKRIKIIYGFLFEGWYYKGQLILKCPIGAIKSSKNSTNFFLGFLPLTSKKRLNHKKTKALYLFFIYSKII